MHMMGSEAKVEIVAKSFVRHQGFDRPIRGDNRSSLAGFWSIVTQAIVLSILQKAQEFELRLPCRGPRLRQGIACRPTPVQSNPRRSASAPVNAPFS